MGQKWCGCLKPQGDPSIATAAEESLEPLLEQDYEKLKSQCLISGKLFEDPLFPASSKSLAYRSEGKLPKQWMRPKEIAGLIGAKPEFFVNGGAAADMIQGELGNCWVVAAASALADHPQLLDRVVPSDQSFSERDYAGIFRFNFYVYGRWVQIVVDDRLPTDHGRMAYVHSSQPNEFWGALLEKAFAKLFGCYEAIIGGACADALTSFTGGVTEVYALKSETPPNIGRVLLHAIDTGSLICTGIWGSQVMALDNGLVTGHAFTVTDIEQVELLTEPRYVTLIKLRNPWGNHIEWRGRWGDRSRAWALITEDTRAKLQYKMEDDGEFWMDINDFVRNFDQVDICNMTHDSAQNTCLRRWQAMTVHGAWIKNKTAGGRLKYYDTFANNPQFEFQIGEVHSGGQERHAVSVIVELTQKRQRNEEPYKSLYIGFVVYQLHNDHIPPMPPLFFQEQPRVGAVDTYANSYVITKRLLLPNGRYLIVPSTWDPNEEAAFLLRVWSQAPIRSASDTTTASGTLYNYPTWNTKRDRNQNKNSLHTIEEERRSQENGHTQSLLAYDQSYENGHATVENPKVLTRMSTQLSDVQNKSAFKLLKSYGSRDMTLNADQLQRGLNSSYAKSKAYRFAIDCCRSLISLVDIDHKFKIYSDEFLALYSCLELWTEKFRILDKRRSGHLDRDQLQNCLFELHLLPLRHTGHPHSPRTSTPGKTRGTNGVTNGTSNPAQEQKLLQPIFQRFCDRMGHISYSDFINCCAKLTMVNDMLVQHKSRYAEGMYSLTAEQILLTLLKS